MKIKYNIMVVALGASIFFSGCAAYGVSDRVTNSAITGAAIGAGVGAVTGGDSDDILRGAAIGGAVGAAGAALTEPQK
ncbi:MAG: hypothetical protein IE880_02645 [Epsilonproteobacteria bacterium]|nr:hypothetical protein [Campylobacterota bacterium]